MFIRLKNLDCELMVLGTKLYIARTSLGANLSVMTSGVAAKMDEVKDCTKNKLNSIKEKCNKKKEDKKQKVEETKSETVEKETSQETTTTESDTVKSSELEHVEAEVVYESAQQEPAEFVMNIPIQEEPPIHHGPIFPGVIYETETDGNMKVEVKFDDRITQPVENTEVNNAEFVEVTEEDLKEAIKAMNKKNKI